jgi:recombination protein RecA
VLDLGVELGLIEKRGSFYTYREERIGQGRENAKEYLRQNAEIAAAVEAQVRDAAQGPVAVQLDEGSLVEAAASEFEA